MDRYNCRICDRAIYTAGVTFTDGTLLLSRLKSSLDERPSKRPNVRSVPLRDVNDVFLSVDGSAVECAVNGRWLSARIYPTK